MSIFTAFIKESIEYINLNLPRIRKCLMEITEDELWKRPNEHSNSIGNIIVHLSGNITQYIHSSLGGEPDIRDRDIEFSRIGGLTRDEVYQKISAVTEKAVSVLQRTTEAELLKVREVQGFDMTGVAIIVHVTEHYSYHVGQITFYTKLLKNKDMGYYAEHDLNKLNEEHQ
ncbi:MAG: DinB family protein [Chitinophagales bacterium]